MSGPPHTPTPDHSATARPAVGTIHCPPPSRSCPVLRTMPPASPGAARRFLAWTSSGRRRCPGGIDGRVPGRGWRQLFPEWQTAGAAAEGRIPCEEPERNHAVRLTTPHGLRKGKNGRPGNTATELPEHAIDQRRHAIGEIVFLKEIRPMHLTIEKGIQVEHRSTAISSKHGRTRGAVKFE
jgi:hypothetical protein